VKTRLAYDIANGVTVGFTYSYDAAFQSVATGDIKWRFGGSQYAPKKTIQLPVALKALSSTPANRDVRVHDFWCAFVGLIGCFFLKGEGERDVRPLSERGK
jgi:hypothetical protein